MPEAFSFNREFDFVRMDGLRRATGRPPHEWDLYIVKELIDNALDADEAPWRRDPRQAPRVRVQVEYIFVPALKSWQLFVRVGNRRPFPVEQIADMFATGWYTSRKAFVKGLSRGALGNALKTILGIPYALRNRVASDWKPDQKPLSIRCGQAEYLPAYEIDSTGQAIHTEYATRPCAAVDGTRIGVGLDHFEQEQPRTIEQIAALADQYHLWNPHASFEWSVEIDDQEWQIAFPALADWQGKFRGDAPVQWYSPNAFQNLLGALHRRHRAGHPDGRLPLAEACKPFVGFSPADPGAEALANVFGQATLGAEDIEGGASLRLYRLLCQRSARFDSNDLGQVGPEHMRAVLSRAVATSGEILYAARRDPGDDPSTPFAIEAAVARLADGPRRIWTAMNFSPTYADPFLGRWLRAPIQPETPVLGLRGLLDAYDLREEAPILLALHLICPNIEHDDFSKTDINHLPFKQALGDLLHELLTTLRKTQEEADLRLEQAIFQALDGILSALDPHERFVFDQLLARLRARLDRDPALAGWLERPDAESRLQSYIASYQSRNTVLSQRVARPAASTLSIPLHPDHHFSIAIEHVSRELLARNHVNKLLYIQARELEPVVIENGWLALMDMALIHNPPRGDALNDALLRCASSNELPLIILHDADAAGAELARKLREWLTGQAIHADRVIPLSLEPDGAGDAYRPRRLVEMMPGELAAWLGERFAVAGVPLKSLPERGRLRQEIRDLFAQLLLGHMWEGMSQQLELTTRLYGEIDRQVGFTQAMRQQALDERLREQLCQGPCPRSYTMVLDEVVQAFFQDLMREHGPRIEQLVQAHVAHMREGHHP